jgi:predicted ATPase
VNDGPSGARFVRADLHVHTFADDGSPPEPLSDYIRVARERQVEVLGITDHNTIQNVRPMLAAAEGSGVLVLPGIEITTHQGHLLALFAPNQVAELEEFAGRENLALKPDQRDGSLRSSRSVLHLVEEIDRRGGLAISAHIDRAGGIVESLGRTELIQLLEHRGLSALEFTKSESLTWFTDADTDAARSAAWSARKAIKALADRGLARVMSSDAHSSEQLGRDRTRRTITRLRIDDPNFTAVKNALVHNPKARCKVEADLPPTYPRVLDARFEGGFLDSVRLSFSGNLTCLIGGRGSGKSTALIALRAALGATLSDDEDPDDAARMPDRTTVRFIDRMGNQRTAVRSRWHRPVDAETGADLTLPVADLGQDESGRLVRRYHEQPEEILAFLDKFCDLGDHRQVLGELQEKLRDNGVRVRETATSAAQKIAHEKELAQLEASVAAAQKGKIEVLVKYSRVLASEQPLLAVLRERIDSIVKAGKVDAEVDIEGLAADFDADLTERPAKDFVDGAGRLRELFFAFRQTVDDAHQRYLVAAEAAAAPVVDLLEQWRIRHTEWQRVLDQRRADLRKQGLQVQVGELERITQRIATVRSELTRLREREKQHTQARAERRRLLQAIDAELDRIYERRRATMKRIVDVANQYATGLTIEVAFDRGGVRGAWAQWLGNRFGFRSPRVQRVADTVTPQELADLILSRGKDGLLSIEADGEQFFAGAPLDRFQEVHNWATLFELQEMTLEDRPRIRVREKKSPDAREFDHLSTGQQRSVLLSLMLCADRLDPLVLDQPEDHLDAGYLASAVVGHIERAKERRQIILATHSPNLVVLGDAELVVPMYADGFHGKPIDQGAVDRWSTRQHVCGLLEGGEDAYRRRGERYGLRVETVD